jgi:hypothetical protein
MKLFRLYYTLKNNTSMIVGMIADNREQAIDSLRKRQKNIHSIERIYIGEDVHAFSDNIVNNLTQNNPKTTAFKKEIQYLKNLLLDSDDEIERLQKLTTDSAPKMHVNSGEMEMLHNKIVELETEKMELMEGKSEPKVVEKIVEKIVEVEGTEKIVEKFICPECLKSFKSPKGVGIHYKRQHKESKLDE